MYSFKTKVLSSLLATVTLGLPLFALTNVSPDTQPEANSLRSPYGLKPAAPVQLGKLNNASGIPAKNAAALNTALSPYFKLGASADDVVGSTKVNYHFNLNNKNLPSGTLSFANATNGKGGLLHTLLSAPPVLKAGPQGAEMRVYFVDTQAAFRNSLGFIDHSAYPANSTVQSKAPGTIGSTQVSPLANLLNGSKSLIFPYTFHAMNFYNGPIGTNTNPAQGGTNTLGRFVNNPLTATAFNATLEHPLLFTDMVSVNMPANKTLDLFLTTDNNRFDKYGSAANTNTAINLTAKDSCSSFGSTYIYPDSRNTSQLLPGVWSTDATHNYGDSLANNFQHFQFYTLPEMGRNWYLVAVEDKGVWNCSDKDYNDLFFVIHCPVPEPQTYAIIGSLLALAFVFSRKRKHQFQQ